MWVVVDPHIIRRAMGGGEYKRKYSASSIKNFEIDLLRAIIKIETPQHKIAGHIIDKIVESEVRRNDRRAWADEESRALQRWIFSEEWTALVQSDIPRYYDPRPLCKIENGSVAAIARHVLTHQNQPNGGWKLAELMKAAGVKRQASKVLREVKENEGLLAEVGIGIQIGIHGSGSRVFLAAPAPTLAAPAPILDEFSRPGPNF